MKVGTVLTSSFFFFLWSPNFILFCSSLSTVLYKTPWVEACWGFVFLAVSQRQCKTVSMQAERTGLWMVVLGMMGLGFLKFLDQPGCHHLSNFPPDCRWAIGRSRTLCDTWCMLWEQSVVMVWETWNNLLLFRQLHYHPMTLRHLWRAIGENQGNTSVEI